MFNENYFNQIFENLEKNEKNFCLEIYTVTWNLHGCLPHLDEINRLFSYKKKFYHLYVVGTQECMRSILASFFNSNKDEWIRLIQYILFI